LEILTPGLHPGYGLLFGPNLMFLGPWEPWVFLYYRSFDIDFISAAGIDIDSMSCDDVQLVQQVNADAIQIAHGSWLEVKMSSMSLLDTVFTVQLMPNEIEVLQWQKW